jgi:hypothetical protein
MRGMFVSLKHFCAHGHFKCAYTTQSLSTPQSHSRRFQRTYSNKNIVGLDHSDTEEDEEEEFEGEVRDGKADAVLKSSATLENPKCSACERKVEPAPTQVRSVFLCWGALLCVEVFVFARLEYSLIMLCLLGICFGGVYRAS